MKKKVKKIWLCVKKYFSLTDRSIKNIFRNMPRTPDQFKEIREEKKSLIMKSALELFANQGFHGTSITDIAAHAGISKGLLYNYFQSKDVLILEIILKGFNELVRFFDPNKDGVLTREEMRYLINGVFTLIENDKHYWRLYFSVLTQPTVNKLASEKLMDNLSPMLHTLTQFFRNLGFENPETEATFFSAMLDGIAMNYVFNPGSFPLNEIKNRILDIYHLNN